MYQKNDSCATYRGATHEPFHRDISLRCRWLVALSDFAATA